MALDIIVYGNSEIFYEYFNAIAAAMGTSTFKTLLRITILLAGTTALFSAIAKKDFLVCVRWFATYYLAFYIIFVPRVDVLITDRTSDSFTRAVSNVPLGLGVLAHLTTTIGDALTQTVEMVFTMPDELKYSQTGMVMASKIALASRQFQITDPALNENMQQFVTHCVFWDILLNHYTMDDLTTAPNIWQFVSANASPAMACIYKSSSGSKVTVCNQAAKLLGAALTANMDKVAAHHGPRLFPNNKTVAAKAELLKYLPLSYGYLLNASSSATDLLQQSVMSNAIIDGALHFGIGANSQTAVSSYANAKAQEQQRLTQNTIGFLAGYWLPIIKNTFEAIMYGCFILVVLLSIFPFGVQVLKNYVFTLCWIQTWPPLYAIINLICSYYAKTNSLGSAQAGFILRDFSGFLQANHDMASLAGYLTMSVPFIAAGLVRGMAGTMTHVAQFMGGVSQAAGSQAAAEAVSGNISMGSTNMRNNSAFNNSSFHQDTRGQMSSGMSYQMPGGESINFMPDGDIAVDRGSTLSNLGVNVDLAKSIHSSAMQQADYSYNTGKSESIAAGENYTAGMRNLYELSNHVGKSDSSGENWVSSESSGATQALSKVKDLTQNFADTNQITYDHAKDILSNAHAGVGANASVSGYGLGGLGANASVGVSGSTQDSDRSAEQKLYRRAEDFVSKSGYSENVEIATRAVHDRSLHSNNEQGARLLDNIAGHFEKADSLRRDAATHFQEAVSYRNIASHAQEDAVKINVNASQDFLKHISNEPGTNGHGRKGVMGAISELRDPENAKIMADNFARAYAKSHLSNWNQNSSTDLPYSGQEVKQTYQDSVAHINEQTSPQILQGQFAQNKANINKSAEQKNLSSQGALDSSQQQTVEDKLYEQRDQVQRAHDQLNDTGLAKAQKFKEESEIAQQNREHGILYNTAKTVAGDIPKTGIQTPSEDIRDKIDE